MFWKVIAWQYAQTIKAVIPISIEAVLLEIHFRRTSVSGMMSGHLIRRICLRQRMCNDYIQFLYMAGIDSLGLVTIKVRREHDGTVDLQLSLKVAVCYTRVKSRNLDLSYENVHRIGNN